MPSLAGRKILLVITKSNWGGAQQYVYTLATRAKEAGAEVIVALGGRGEINAPAGLLATRLQEAGIRTVFLSSFSRDVSILREWVAFLELLHVVHRENPDVLHLNSSKAGGIGALAGRLLRVRKILFTAHGWPHKEPRSFLPRVFIWLASYATVLLAHTVIVLSREQYDASPALFLRSRLVIIPNGVENFPLLDRTAARAQVAERDARTESYARLILSTSELHPNKGLDTLLDAFARIAPEYPDTALVLMHGGESRDALVARAAALSLSNRVFFLGFVPDARSLLCAADIFVLPSRKEGLPFGLLEAGRAGVPVIASGVGTIPEIIQNGVTGILTPSGDISALCTALTLLLTDRVLGTRLGRAFKEHVERDFSETSMISKTFLLYEVPLVGKVRASRN